MAFEDHLVDYAPPLIELQNRLRKINDLSLDKKYKEAWELLPECISEIRVLQAVFIIMAEKEQAHERNPKGIPAEQ